MNRKKIRPYLFENMFLLIAIDSKWAELFDDIEFDVYIHENRLNIRSQEIKND